MDEISIPHGWDKEIPHGILPMGQLVLSENLGEKFLSHPETKNGF